MGCCEVGKFEAYYFRPFGRELRGYYNIKALNIMSGSAERSEIIRHRRLMVLEI